MISSLILFIVGLIAIVIGIGLFSVPWASIVGGSLCVLIALLRMVAVARTPTNGS